MTGEYTLEGLAVPDSLELLHDLLQRVRADWPAIEEVDLAMFETAVVEIHGNVVRHGRPRGQVVYGFALEVHDDRLVATLTDTAEPAPGLSQHGGLPEGLAEEGRGLWLAKATLDELDYRRVGDRNSWRLVRRRGTVSDRGAT
jgi:serine/threonine-protein kinase RsbW